MRKEQQDRNDLVRQGEHIDELRKNLANAKEAAKKSRIKAEDAENSLRKVKRALEE